jgi:hypothetical protein
VNKLFLGQDTGCLIKHQHNDHNLFLIHRTGFDYIYIGRDCHQVEGDSNLLSAHSCNLICTIKRMETKLAVVKFIPNSMTLDLSDQIDSFFSLSEIRNTGRNVDIQNSTGIGIIDGLLDQLKVVGVHPERKFVPIPDDELVEMAGVQVPRHVKQYARALGKLLAKRQHYLGIKPIKRAPLPFHLQGLTTQEFREVIRRDEEDLIKWVEERGYKALSKDSLIWYRTPQASEWRRRIIKIGTQNTNLAMSEWTKFKNTLASYGSPGAKYLPFPSDQVQREKEAIAKRLTLRADQLKARDVWVQAKFTSGVPKSLCKAPLKGEEWAGALDDDDDWFAKDAQTLDDILPLGFDKDEGVVDPTMPLYYN